MGITGFSSSVDTTIDVNNGQSTQTFSQQGDAEYDIDVTSSVGYTTLDVDTTFSGDNGGSPVQIDEAKNYARIQIDVNSVDTSGSISYALRDPGTEHMREFNNISSTQTITVDGAFYVDDFVVTNISGTNQDFETRIRAWVDTTSSTTVNSISQV